MHELTFSCYQRKQLLKDDSRLGMWSEAVSRATERHQFELIAFVWMPEHVHMLVLPRSPTCRISSLLSAMKRPFSFRVKQQLQESNPALLQQLTVRQRPGVMTFRFWQEGPGYDRNITESRTLRSAIDYIHENPVRRRLCERDVDWNWSSARYFHFGEAAANLPRIDPIRSELLE